MPFTANCAFSAPRMLVAAKDMYYTTATDVRFWTARRIVVCERRPPPQSITAAIREQAGIMDYAPPPDGTSTRLRAQQLVQMPRRALITSSETRSQR
jgi:hypothetical protein